MSMSARHSDVLAQFIDRLNGVNDLKVLKDVAANTLQQLGFRFFAYHCLQVKGVGERLPYAITTYPIEWVKRYLDQHYIHHDPVLAAVKTHHLPFLWSEVTSDDEMTPVQRQLFGEAREYSVTDGMTVPIHGRLEMATMSLVPDASGAEAAEIMRANRDLIHLLALYYHNHSSAILLERSQASRTKSLLTPREQEILSWLARGKTTWEISEILVTSEKTVVFHIENAKRKLGVFNRTHAVVKALMLGLIPLD
ncbi:MAG: LuxR family transcriptional regulator [Alphaproteobacteria bacterium]|nr:LuxR family transcriptional regulator [Alphaproteobacteria bacterium]